ncbi:MAG: prefoldin subunit [Nanoarchaeota archaeon]|nr:prefoldin subunit [Nanoarchaeota archaeon]
MAKKDNIESEECGDEECECGHNHAEQGGYNPFENLDQETQRKIQEMQVLEQTFQQISMQKQTFSFELTETDFALEELKTNDGEVFKIVGNQIIIRTTKEKLEKELAHKKELIALRLKNLDKQEEEFSKRLESLRDEVIKKISNKDADK